MTAASPVEPCGGCGNADPAKVCIGCLHFATPPASPAEQPIDVVGDLFVWLGCNRDVLSPDAVRALQERIDATASLIRTLKERATPPASPAATDEEVAEWRVGYWHWGGADIYVMDPSSTSTINGEGVRYIAKGLPTFDMAEAIVKEHNAAADLFARVARERDEARDWLRLRAHDIVELGQQLAAAEQRAEAAEKVLAIANRGGLDLLYAVRKAIGWTDKHALSLLPDECARLKKAAVRNAPIWPGKDFDHSQPGGFDGPTGAD